MLVLACIENVAVAVVALDVGGDDARKLAMTFAASTFIFHDWSMSHVSMAVDW